MGKKNFQNGDDWSGADARKAWYDNGGHKHDGIDEDGHAQKINLSNGAEVTGQLPPSMVTGVIPIGTPMPNIFGGVPDDTWLPCDGSAFNHADYPLLPAGLDITYPTEYRTPPLNGRVIIGIGTLGSDVYAIKALGGEARVALTTPEQGAVHSHEIVANTGDAGTAVADGGQGGVVTRETEDSVGGETHENRMPYMALNYIIKAK